MKKTIKKVLDELDKERPDLSYMRGLLEGLVDEDVVSIDIPKKVFNAPKTATEVSLEIDEASILEAQTKAHIAKFGMPDLKME